MVVLKIGTILCKKSLKGFFISLVGARLVYLKSPSLLEHIEIYNLLLELSNLIAYFLNRVSLSLGNLEGSKSLRRHYIFILYSQ
jgi:hypothetical protein